MDAVEMQNPLNLNQGVALVSDGKFLWEPPPCLQSRFMRGCATENMYNVEPRTDVKV